MLYLSLMAKSPHQAALGIKMCVKKKLQTRNQPNEYTVIFLQIQREAAQTRKIFIVMLSQKTNRNKKNVQYFRANLI